MSKTCAIIPTYNRADYISECIESLLAQSRPVDQIIVVNDGASDNTDEVMKCYKNQITYIKKENGGKSSALNLALKHTDAEYIWICDDDDYADPDALKHMMSGFKKNSEVGYVFGTFQIFTETANGNRTYQDPYFWKRKEEPNLKINFLEMMFTYQFAMLVKREVYEKVGKFNEDLVRSQDYDMTLRLTRTYKGIEVPNIIFYQREHDGARGTGAAKFSAADKMKKWMEYDRTFFVNILATYDLDEFTPSFAYNWEREHKIRATHLQRGLILAEHSLWNEAATDIKSAIMASSANLSNEERNILEKIIRNHTAWKALIADSSAKRSLKEIYKSSSLGQNITVAMFRPIMWLIKKSVKQRNFKEALSYIFLIRSILGFGGLTVRIQQSLIQKK